MSAFPPKLERWRNYWPALVIALGVPVAAIALYVFVTPSFGAPGEPTHAAMTGSRDGGDLAQAVLRLRARLVSNPNDVDGWRLLAQSYEYLGQKPEAAEATRMADAVAGGGDDKITEDFSPAMLAKVAGTLDRSSGYTPGDLVSRAQDLRRQRKFGAANELFAELARGGGMSPDLWADYADSLGGERGKLDGDAERCIAAALQLDPRHPKALWLRGSLQTQRADFAAALLTWQELASVLPPESSDARLIASNIKEAQSRLRPPEG